MGFLTLEGLERFWNHIVALVDSLNLKSGTGVYSIQQIQANEASGFSSVALGDHTTAKGNYSTTIGYGNIANGDYSMAAGQRSKAMGHYSFAEGYSANANGNYSQAKGHYVNANGSYSTVIGKYNDTPDNAGFYESLGTLYQTFENNATYTKVIGTPILDAENGYWIFEGTEEVLGSTLAIGDYVCNSNTQWCELTSLKSSNDTSRTFNDKRHNINSYNDRQSTYAFAVGNGASDTARGNAHTLDWNGNAWFAGDVSVGENKAKLVKDGEQDFVVTFTVDADGNFTSNKTFEETLEAYNQGYNIVAKAEDSDVLGIFSSYNMYMKEDGEKFFLFLFETSKILGFASNTGIIFSSGEIFQQEFPATTNEPLTFTGAVNATYDGSGAITVNIPEMGSYVSWTDANNAFIKNADLIIETTEGKNNLSGPRGMTNTSYDPGSMSFSWGNNSSAQASYSFALGRSATVFADANYSYALGQEATVYDGALNSYAIGYGATVAYDVDNAFAIGDHVSANVANQTVLGKYNKSNTSYLFVLGNGTSSTRSNAFAINPSGTGYFTGDLYVNGSGTTTAFTGAKKVATESYVDTKVAGLVDSAPGTLNTLNELAAALGDDPNFATTVATEIGKKADKTDLVALTEAEILEVCVIN